MASAARIQTDCQDRASPDDVSCCNVVPAWIAMNEGGATPANRRQQSNTVKLHKFIKLQPLLVIS